MKPMLAAKTDGKTLHYPLIASPKLDGVRCLIVDGVALSRTLKPIPNKFIQSILGKPEYNGLDGELIIGSPSCNSTYNTTVSGVMREGGEPDFDYYIFDVWNSPKPYFNRLEIVETSDAIFMCENIKVLGSCTINEKMELLEYEKACLGLGFEGIVLRNPLSIYKFGRSTVKEAALLKMKRFEDAEAVITGFTELLHNANEATTDALGHTKRSSHKANKQASGTLGVLEVRDMLSGVTFEIGTGFDTATRQHIWDNRDKYAGKLVKYKYFATSGVKDKPRFPTFLGFRSELDL